MNQFTNRMVPVQPREGEPGYERSEVMMNQPSTEEQIAELRAAGWEHVSNSLWRSPSGSLWLGPHGAWIAMRRAIAPAQKRRELAERIWRDLCAACWPDSPDAFGVQRYVGPNTKTAACAAIERVLEQEGR
jgi:hypothetical protein